MKTAPPRFRKTSLSWFILLAGVAMTAVTSYFAYETVTLPSSYRFHDLSEQIRTRLDSRLKYYSAALSQARALFLLHDEPTRDHFQIVYDSLHASREHPGFIGMGFVQKVDDHERRELRDDIRQDYRVKDIDIWAAASSSKTVSSPLIVRFFESTRANDQITKLVGFAMESDPQARRALDLARDTGKPAISGRLNTVLDETYDTAMIMAVPVFDFHLPVSTPSERAAALKGYVFAAFRSRQFFNGIVPRSWTADKQIGFIVVDDPRAERPDTGSVVYSDLDAGKSTNGSAAHQRRFEVDIGARPLSVNVVSMPNFEHPLHRALPILVFITGSVLSLIAFRMLQLNQRQADELSKSERQLKLVTDHSPNVVCYIDTQQRYRFVNKTIEKWYQLDRENAIGMQVESLIGPDAYAKVKPRIERVLKGESLSFELDAKTRDGRVRPLHATYIPDFGPSGRVKGYVSLINDLTETRKATERSRFLAELSAILASSLDVETTLQKLATLLTPAVADWCMIDLVEENGIHRTSAHSADPAKEAILQQLCTSLSSDHDPGEFASTVIKSGEPILSTDPTAEVFLPRALTSPLQLDIVRQLKHSSALFVPLKARNRVLGAITLVTAGPERRLDSNDLAFTMDIARRAALAIENAMLYREAQHANRSKDEFLATLSHELRTPMNVILGWLELLGTDTFDKETFDQALATLNRNAHLQLQLINDLLDISRIISGKIGLQVSRIDFRAIVEQIVEGFRPAARARNIDLRSEISLETDALLSVDPNRINQILWNLLSNALKFTPEGGTVSVRLTGDDNFLKLAVSDTGRGIDPHFLPFIFDRFRQEDSGTTRTQGGLGLGLSIVRYLMELHGGSIDAFSEGRGRGATFQLTFSRRFEIPDSSLLDASASPNAFPQNRIARPAGRQLEGVRVLLLDDSPDVRTLIHRVLTRAGAQVTLAETSKDAEILLRAERPDVFLSDIGLPDEDGLQFIRRYRELERAQGLESLPAAALTAYAQGSDVQSAIEAGFDCHVPKPVTSATLLQVVASLAFESSEIADDADDDGQPRAMA